MSLIHNDALECAMCGHQEFKQEELLTFHKKVRARDEYNKSDQLPAIERRITYVCANCKHVLNK